MSFAEALLLVVAVSQPLCVGAFAYVGALRLLSRGGFGLLASTRRERVSAFRFYECATYSRLASMFAYPISFVMVLCSYIIYDVDVALFVCEALLAADAGLSELFILAALVALTAAGLVFDYRTSGYG